MNGHPPRVYCSHKRYVFPVWDDAGGMPAGATINHMEYDKLVSEDKVTLHLLVEGICNFHITGIAWPRFSSFPADSACMHNAGNQVQDHLYHLRALGTCA